MTDPIRAALERLVTAYDTNEGLLIEEWLQIARTAIALDRSRRAPVPVSERPWAREGWCDEDGRCWFGAPQDGAADAGWILRKPSERLSHQTVSLPAHSLPLPAGEPQP